MPIRMGISSYMTARSGVTLGRAVFYCVNEPKIADLSDFYVHGRYSYRRENRALKSPVFLLIKKNEKSAQNYCKCSFRVLYYS